MFDPLSLMKEAKGAKEAQKLNHEAEMKVLTEIREVLGKILAALSQEEAK